MAHRCAERRQSRRQHIRCIAFGLLVIGVGLFWLWPARELLRLDTSAQLAHETTHGWLGRHRVTTVPFTEVESIGTDTFKDPRNGTVWRRESVLRLKNGRRISAGRAEDAETAGKLAGLPVDHRIVLMEEPVQDGG